MSAKRDCLFYEEYRDMGATMDFCTIKGSSMEVMEACHCDDCPYFYSLDWMKYIFRQAIKMSEERRGRNDANETI